MASRKVTKREISEVVDKATEVGNVSPPKRKKTVSKTVNKTDEEKRLRTPKPRTAKLPKSEQIQNVGTISTITRTTRGKALPVIKDASKPNSGVKLTTRKNKEPKNIKAVNAGTAKNVEEKETKKPRTKAVTKKAGTESKEEPKDRVKRNAKKDNTTESTETAEVIPAKKRKQAPADTVPKETKPKATAIKKTVDAKNKAIKTRVTNDGGENSVETTTKTKKTENDTSAKPTRALRGRRNKGTSEDTPKDDQELKAEAPLLSSTARAISDNESHEVENNQLDTANSVQASKRGKNLKKKEAPQKKAVARNSASNENVVVKTIKETTIPVVMKKGRGKKGATPTVAIEENGEKVSEDEIKESDKILNMSEKDNDKENSAKEELSEAVNGGETLKQDTYENNITVTLGEIEN